ncbi:MAG: B12-binding domain-containing protein, partial [Elusimicrobiota bacterium]
MDKNQTIQLAEISKAIIRGDSENIQSIVQQALKKNIPAKNILEYGLIAGMATVGEKFRISEMFIPEVMAA